MAAVCLTRASIGVDQPNFENTIPLPKRYPQTYPISVGVAAPKVVEVDRWGLDE